MNPKQLIIKCYAEREGDVWGAHCLDFNLAAQGDSFEDAKTRLESMITEYVYDALVGEDRFYASQLLSRRAPLSAWLKYYLMKFKNIIFHSANYTFDETMPLRPA
jgi:predicted RNase H-like HicB family nuclease